MVGVAVEPSSHGVEGAVVDLLADDGPEFARTAGAGDWADVQARPRAARPDCSRMDAEVCDVIIDWSDGLSWRVSVSFSTIRIF